MTWTGQIGTLTQAMTIPPNTPAYAQTLSGGALSTTRATAAAAFALARSTFRQGERIDMAKLAEELGVARTTLYRWTGDREQLISDILWGETSATLDALASSEEGGDVVSAQVIASGFIDALVASEPLRRFLHNEGQRALLLLTAPDGAYRTRLLAKVTALIERGVAHGYRPPETPELLADSIISLTERFLHNGGEPLANPSPEMAKRAIALLLRE